MDNDLSDSLVSYEQGVLETDFLAAVEAFAEGKLDDAEAGFRKVLAGDPRLPEPRLELALIRYSKGDLLDAEAHARFALEQIEKGWQWLDNFGEGQLQAHALTVLGRILLDRFSADDTEDVARGDLAIWREAEGHFQRAVELDPDNGEARSGLAGFKRQRQQAKARA